MYIDQLYSPTPLTQAMRAGSMINEGLLLEEPSYREWRQIGQQLCELDLSKQQILSLFGNVEQTMTNRDTGANRTMLGRGKDVTTKYAGKIKDMTNKILSSVQDSVPVEAIDTYYNQATNALGQLVGGDKGKVMKAIMTYRNLAKAYPKTAGFAKAALVAIAGLATGGAGLPVIAGLTYGLDSAIQGDRLSTVLGKGAGAAALAYAGQQVAGALGGGDATAATLAQQPAGMNLSYDNFVTANPTTTLTPAQFAAQKAARTLPEQAAAGGVDPELATLGGMRESWIPVTTMHKLPMEQLIDKKLTTLSWALNESVGKTQGRSVHLTHHGVATVFENVHRVGEAIVKELRGVPGSMPGYLSPDLPGGPGKPVRPGAIGRGLNWLDKKAGQLGGFIKRTGHELTTNVTKDKLQMKWQTAGEPTDSDAVANLLIKNKVPAEIVQQVFGQMGIPYTAPSATQAADPASKVAVGQAFPKIIKPGTTRYYTKKELDALQAGQAPVAAAPAASTVAAQPTVPAAAPAAKPAAKTGTLPGFDYKSVMQMPGMKPAPAKPASFAVPNAYGKTTYSVKPSAAASTKPAKAAASLTPNEYIKRLGAPALPESKQFVKSLVSQVREALQNVTCQEDIARVKNLIDRAFVNHGLVNESAQALRDSMIREVVTIGAQRRRQAAQR